MSLAGSALALLAAVAPLSAAVKNPDTYVHLLQGMSDNLDPFSGNQEILENVYETLFDYEGSTAPVPAPRLAAGVPSRANGLVSEDGREIRIPIRRGVRFHDGSPLTPEDVRYSILRDALVERAELGGSALLLRRMLLGVSTTRGPDGRPDAALLRRGFSAVRVDGDSVVLTLPRPDASAAAMLASRPVIVARAWAAARGDWDGRLETLAASSQLPSAAWPRYDGDDGTGPFAVEFFDKTGRELMLRRFEGYWRAPARLRRVDIRAVPEFATRKLMLQSGDADSIVAYREHQTQLAGLPGVTVIDGLRPDNISPVAYFSLRVSTAANRFIGSGRLDGEGIPPDFFADLDARLGIIAAFDYEAFRREVLRGKAARPAGIVPAGVLGRFAGRGPFRRDLAKARAHWRKAWGGRAWERGFRFSLVYNEGNDMRRDFAAVFKKSVESLNPRFHVDVVGLEWPTFLAALHARRIPVEVFGIYGAYADPHPWFFNVLHSEGYCARRLGYANPSIDALIDQAQAEPSAALREALYRRIQDLSFADPFYLIPAEASAFRVQRSWVRGWSYEPYFPNAPYSGSFYRLWKREPGDGPAR